MATQVVPHAVSLREAVPCDEAIPVLDGGIQTGLLRRPSSQ
jgi:hypothetical protein